MRANSVVLEIYNYPSSSGNYITATHGKEKWVYYMYVQTTKWIFPGEKSNCDDGYSMLRVGNFWFYGLRGDLNRLLDRLNSPLPIPGRINHHRHQKSQFSVLFIFMPFSEMAFPKISLSNPNNSVNFRVPDQRLVSYDFLEYLVYPPGFNHYPQNGPFPIPCHI